VHRIDDPRVGREVGERAHGLEDGPDRGAERLSPVGGEQHQAHAVVLDDGAEVRDLDRALLRAAALSASTTVLPVTNTRSAGTFSARSASRARGVGAKYRSDSTSVRRRNISSGNGWLPVRAAPESRFDVPDPDVLEESHQGGREDGRRVALHEEEVRPVLAHHVPEPVGHPVHDVVERLIRRMMPRSQCGFDAEGLERLVDEVPVLAGQGDADLEPRFTGERPGDGSHLDRLRTGPDHDQHLRGTPQRPCLRIASSSSRTCATCSDTSPKPTSTNPRVSRSITR
jgi:hypothetical protein